MKKSFFIFFITIIETTSGFQHCLGAKTFLEITGKGQICKKINYRLESIFLPFYYLCIRPRI